MIRTKKNENTKQTVSEKTTGHGIPGLDAVQRQVIATLEASSESWIKVQKYNPLRSHDSLETRFAAGKALRKKVPRESHANWDPPKNRPSGADFVIAGNAGRQQDLVPLRMGRMAASPFAFGLYGTLQRDVIIDLNDFDESIPGPWE